MPTARTKSKPSAETPRAVPRTIRDAHRRQRADALTRWREWARAAADGGDIPSPGELLAAGALLGLASPAEALEADATACRDLAHAEAQIVFIDATNADRLAQFGGDRAGLAREIEATEQRLRELKEVLFQVDGSPFFYRHRRAGLLTANPRLFAPLDRVLVDLEADE